MPNCTEKTMLILRALSDSKGVPVALERLSEITGINKSTASHILKTLCFGGYVHRVSHTLGYLPGPELHMLTRYGRYGEDIITECHPILEYLYRKCGGTAVFALINKDKKYIIDRVSDDNLYHDGDAGILRDDIYRTVTGRVLLASMPLDEALEIYDSLGNPDRSEWSEVRTRGDFLEELSKIAEMPCYFLKIKSGDRVWLSFACAVHRNGICVGAIGLALRFSELSSLPSEAETADILRTVIACRNELERRLGFNAE